MSTNLFSFFLTCHFVYFNEVDPIFLSAIKIQVVINKKDVQSLAAKKEITNNDLRNVIKNYQSNDNKQQPRAN